LLTIFASEAIHVLYKKLLTLYPRAFRERMGESMQQTFNDLYKERGTNPSGFSFVLWMFVETAVGIVREYVLLITQGAAMKGIFANSRSTALISSMLLAMTFIVAPLFYLVGNLRDAMGPFSYDMADFLYGPVWGASLVTIIYVLREHLGARAPRRMSLALLAAVLAAGIAVAVAFIRSANRHYHMIHPELHLENSLDVLVVWATLIAGLTNTGWHFLGWALVLIGSAGWSSHYLPRLLSALYLMAGLISLFVYLIPGSEGLAVMLSVIVMVWQGILLSKAEPKETQVSGINTSQLDQV
jgi:hypothetical protein